MSAGGFNSTLNMPSSYYVATAKHVVAFPALIGAADADLCIVGGGCTGLSAALYAAEQGLSVILLEGGKVGWGASGRNGGQIIPGLRKRASELVRLYGETVARALFELALEARALVLALIERHRIDCDLKLTGHLSVASGRGDVAQMQEEVEFLHEVMNYPYVRFLDSYRVREEVAARYHGGVLDELGGHLHPLSYTQGLARAASRASARIFEDAPVTRVEQGAGVTIYTAAGQVRAHTCILAGDALLDEVGAGVTRYIMPVANYIGATEPLRNPSSLIANDRAVSDSRFVVSYFRLSADGRLLFGGGERYSPRPPKDIKAFARRHMLRVFPQLDTYSLDHAWGGLVAVTRNRLPHVGRTGKVLYAHGYSGMGVILSSLAGQLLVDDVLGRSRKLDLFTHIAPRPFPGGPRLRPLLHLLGMLWFAMLDRLPKPP